MLRQMQEKANFGVAGNAVEGTYPGDSARGRYEMHDLYMIRF